MANYYHTSTGERITQRTINSRLAQAKKGFMERWVCESCKGLEKDHFAAWSHTISQKRCKQLHRTELIWSENNGSWDCNICHNQWESYKSGQFQHHFNFKTRMSFVAEFDYNDFMARFHYITNPDLIAWCESLMFEDGSN